MVVKNVTSVLFLACEQAFRLGGVVWGRGERKGILPSFQKIASESKWTFRNMQI